MINGNGWGTSHLECLRFEYPGYVMKYRYTSSNKIIVSMYCIFRFVEMFYALRFQFQHIVISSHYRKHHTVPYRLSRYTTVNMSRFGTRFKDILYSVPTLKQAYDWLVSSLVSSDIFFFFFFEETRPTSSSNWRVSKHRKMFFCVILH